MPKIASCVANKAVIVIIFFHGKQLSSSNVKVLAVFLRSVGFVKITKTN